MGVFINATSASTLPTPASLDFYSLGTSFTSLSPLLDQVFYIGDGLTGDGSGSTQQFDVPAGATELVLGLGDAPGYNGNPGSYGDNLGAFNASFQVGSSSAPDNSSTLGLSVLAMAALMFAGAFLKDSRTSSRQV
jgi:hypothetical protein